MDALGGALLLMLGAWIFATENFSMENLVPRPPETVAQNRAIRRRTPLGPPASRRPHPPSDHGGRLSLQKPAVYRKTGVHAAPGAG